MPMSQNPKPLNNPVRIINPYAGNNAVGWSPNAAIPAGKPNTPAPTIALTKLKISLGMVAVPPVVSPPPLPLPPPFTVVNDFLGWSVHDDWMLAPPRVWAVGVVLVVVVVVDVVVEVPTAPPRCILERMGGRVVVVLLLLQE